jgi:hypothetical protein
LLIIILSFYLIEVVWLNNLKKFLFHMFLLFFIALPIISFASIYECSIKKSNKITTSV